MVAPADVATAAAAARTAFDEGPWPRITAAERAGYLREMAVMLAERVDGMAAVAPLETGVLRSLARGSASLLPSVFTAYAEMAETFPFLEQHVPGPTGGGGTGLLVQEPVGVVAAIVPWNGPALISAYKTALALLAGCTVVLKMPPEAPSSGYVLAEVAEAVGLPAGGATQARAPHPYICTPPACGPEDSGRHGQALLRGEDQEHQENGHGPEAIGHATGPPPGPCGSQLAPGSRPSFLQSCGQLWPRGKIRADLAHRKLVAMSYQESERSTRRAVAEVKQAWQAGRRRRDRPWVPEPGCGCIVDLLARQAPRPARTAPAGRITPTNQQARPLVVLCPNLSGFCLN